MQVRRLFYALTLTAIAALASVSPGSTQGDDKDPAAEQREKLAGHVDRFDESTSLRWTAEQLQQYSQLPGDEILPMLLDVYERPARVRTRSCTVICPTSSPDFRTTASGS